MPDVFTVIFGIAGLPVCSPLFSQLLSGEERSRIDRLKIPLKAERLANAHAQCRLLLAAFIQSRNSGFSFEAEELKKLLNIGDNDSRESRSLWDFARALQLSKGPWGKPYIADHPEISFNLSHSGELAGVSLTCGRDSRLEIGLDLEKIEDGRDHRHIAERFFHPDEQELLLRSPEPDRARLFTEIWTRKEACAKMWGTGLSISFASFSALGGRVVMPANRLLPAAGSACLYLRGWYPQKDLPACLALNFVPEKALFFDLRRNRSKPRAFFP